MQAAVQWMLPLVVESIWDGDSAARLKIVAIADYNSAPPLPQIYKAPLSSYATLDEVQGRQRGEVRLECGKRTSSERTEATEFCLTQQNVA